MSKEKIRIKAAKNAPEGVGHGNFYVEKTKGFYVTDDRKFADHIIASGYGEEASAEEAKTEGGTE